MYTCVLLLLFMFKQLNSSKHSKKMDFITIKDEKSKINLPTKNNLLKLKTLQTYFHNANGLTFILNGEKCAVEVINDELEIIPGVQEYNVFYSNVLKDNCNKTNEAKKRKMHEILAVIEGNEENENFMKLHSKATVKKKVTKKILYIGWKHRSRKEGKFTQIREPTGGIKNIELFSDVQYTYNEIKQFSINAMKHKYNEIYFENSSIKLGNFNEEIFEKFTNLDGDDCNFWEFSIKLRSRNSQLRLYLFTEPLLEERASKQNFVKSHTLVSSSHLSTINNNNEHNFEFSKNFPSVHFQNLEEPENHIHHRNETECHNSTNRSFIFQLSNKGIYSHISISSNKSEKNVQLKSPNMERIDLKLTIPIINIKDITFTNNVLGRGAFGRVIQATWLGTDVAVKEIKLSTNDKYLLREIAVMDKVRHPNIISIMAVSRSEKNCYIVMEYFASNTLRNVLFDVKVKCDYEIDLTKKKLIIIQMCKAVNYLHQLNPLILHKDLKPENVLVNKQFVTKICDLGLSKIYGLSSSLDTTIGNHFHGTPLYMPPEILINNQPGTINSDIWSLACCIVEVFTEKRIWNVSPKFNLSILKNTIVQRKPDLSKVPVAFQSILSACFEQNPMKRPNANFLLTKFQEM